MDITLDYKEFLNMIEAINSDVCKGCKNSRLISIESNFNKEFYKRDEYFKVVFELNEEEIKRLILSLHKYQTSLYRKSESHYLMRHERERLIERATDIEKTILRLMAQVPSSPFTV